MSVRTILVAEDDAEVRELVRAQLTAAGYEVVVVRNGHEALTRIRTFRLDAVVLDINLPEVDGFGVLEGIREIPGTAGLPVLVLSARHAEQDVRRAVQLGARDYITKPFTAQQLVGRVGRLFRGRFVPPTSGVPAR